MIANRDYAEAVEVPVSFLPHVVGVEQISAETGEAERLEMTDRAVTLALRPGGGKLLRLETEFEYPRPPEVMQQIDFQFERDGDTLGWGRPKAMMRPIAADGLMRTQITGHDPHIARGMLRIPPDTHSVLKVRMRITGGGDQAQLFWATAMESRFRDDKYLNFDIQPDGQWHEYTIPVGEHEKWAGQQIVALRLDPSVGDAAGEIVEIDYIIGE
jgi:hypothetical protein